MIVTSRHNLKNDLKAYGEFELAEKIDSLSDEDMNTIGCLAINYINNGSHISKHLTLATIEFFEGESREPKRKKRDMSFYYDSEPEPNKNLFNRIFKKK